MNTEERVGVLERLQELEGWAEYILEALHLDQSSEPLKRAVLERVVETPALRQLRELSWSLRDKLHLIVTQLELTRQKQPASKEALR